MLRFAVIAAVGALGAAGYARAVSTVEPTQAATEPAAQLRRLPADEMQATKVSATAAALVKAADGHFWAEGSVNGKRVRFLVDTGASAVALTLADARRLGLTGDLDYSVQVSTANGVTRAAPVTLDTVSVAGARIAGVQAFVVEDGLETSLLGMSYLGRLSRFEATPTALILRP